MDFVRNKKSLLIGIFCILVSLFFLGISIWSGDFKSHIIFLLLQAVVGFMSIINAITPGFLGEKQYGILEDERDGYIVSKCTMIASKIMFYCIIFVMFLFSILYIVYENVLFFAVSVSLLSCLLLYTIVYLIANIYYEKRG